MSHIATLQSRLKRAECRDSGRDFSTARFYTVPMALRIKQLRESKGWTQEHLAALARMSRSQLAMIERETRPANTLRLNAIAAALGVPPEQLFESSSPDARLLELLRELSPQDRAMLVQLAESLAAKSASG
jgi:transcriptional regulator with XRE-family HTH domain